MAARTQICRVGDAATGKFFKGSATAYTADNATVTGITPEGSSDFASTPFYDTAELIRVGILQRLNIRCRTGGGKVVTYGILVEQSKAKAAIDHYNTDGKTLNGNTVLSASFGRRRILK